MRQFYVGNINLLSYSNKTGEKITLIRENVPLYKTRTQRWVKVEDGTPPNTEEEARDYLDNNRKRGILEDSVSFLDESTIKQSSMTEEEAKKLRKKYKEKSRKKQLINF